MKRILDRGKLKGAQFEFSLRGFILVMSLKLMNLWLVYKLITGKLRTHVFPQTAEVS